VIGVVGGDSMEDVSAESVGVRGIVLSTDENSESLIELDEDPEETFLVPISGAVRA